MTGERRRRRSRRRGVYENPLQGWETAAAIGMAAVGYVATDVLDRFIVSRDRSDPKDTTGKTLLGKRWNTAPLMDDLLVRGGVGAGLAVAPLVAAHFVSNGTARSALQGFGIGAAVRLIGKVADDLATYLLRNGAAATDDQDNAKRSLGRRLYGTELNSRGLLAAELPAADQAAYTGTAGLGAAPCATCGQSAGLGRCNCGRPSSMLPSCDVPSNPTGVSPVGSMAPNCLPRGTTPGGGIDLTRNGDGSRNGGGGGSGGGGGIDYTHFPGGGTDITGGGPGGGTDITGRPAMSPIPVGTRLPAALPSSFGPLRGLGSVEHAREILRTYEPAYRAVRSNAAALAAARNNTANPQQRATAEHVTQSHAEGIRAMASFHPATLETAARGLGFLDDGTSSSTKWPGASRHRERDDAAE